MEEGSVKLYKIGLESPLRHDKVFEQRAERS